IPSISNIHTIFSTRLVENGNWIDNVSNFIVSPIGALILTCIIFLGFLYQLYSNRINIIGIISTLALFIFFLGFFIKGDVNFYSVVLFAIGVIFVIIELFVVGAIIGIIGMALIVFSIVTLGDNLVYMIANVVVALILSIIEWVILVKFFKRKIPFLDKVVLKDSTNAEAGYTSHEDRSHLVGEVAVTSTDLRPAGIIIYNDERIDAVSDGSFILRNKKVTILEVEGTRVVVREIETLRRMSMIGILIIAVIVVIALLLLFSFVPVGLWISAIAAGVKVGIGTLVGMRLRRVSPRKVISPLIKAHKAGLNLTTNQLESHYLAGGNVDRVVDANIAAQRADINLPFERGAAIDLAGRDVLEAVQMSVNPKVIETPFIAGVAMNGIEVKAKARITVRANIARLVGGAGEETIIARVGEGIVSTIGSSEHHTQVLENPDNISKTVLSKGLDSGTAFEILSIDIADVDISKNIGADLQTEQAL